MESWGGGIVSQVEAGLHAVRPFGKAAARRPTSTLLRHVIIAIASVACTVAIVRAIANESAQAISLSGLSIADSNKQLQGSADSADSRATSNLARYLILSQVIHMYFHTFPRVLGSQETFFSCRFFSVKQMVDFFRTSPNAAFAHCHGPPRRFQMMGLRKL